MTQEQLDRAIIIKEDIKQYNDLLNHINNILFTDAIYTIHINSPAILNTMNQIEVIGDTNTTLLNYKTFLEDKIKELDKTFSEI
jgi:hypothetical protein